MTSARLGRWPWPFCCRYTCSSLCPRPSRFVSAGRIDRQPLGASAGGFWYSSRTTFPSVAGGSGSNRPALWTDRRILRPNRFADRNSLRSPQCFRHTHGQARRDLSPAPGSTAPPSLARRSSQLQDNRGVQTFRGADASDRLQVIDFMGSKIFLQSVTRVRAADCWLRVSGHRLSIVRELGSVATSGSLCKLGLFGKKRGAPGLARRTRGTPLLRFPFTGRFQILGVAVGGQCWHGSSRSARQMVWETSAFVDELKPDFNVDERLGPSVLGVKMGRRVIAEIHLDDDSVKSTELRHRLARSSAQGRCLPPPCR